MNEHTLNELHDALSTLRTDIAIAIGWDTLHRWFGVVPLDLPHYSAINRQWSQTWHQARWCAKPHLTTHQPLHCTTSPPL